MKKEGLEPPTPHENTTRPRKPEPVLIAPLPTELLLRKNPTYLTTFSGGPVVGLTLDSIYG